MNTIYGAPVGESILMWLKNHNRSVAELRVTVSNHHDFDRVLEGSLPLSEILADDVERFTHVSRERWLAIDQIHWENK